MVRRTIGGASVLVASFLAVLVTIAGLKVIASGAAPVLLGQTVDGDQSYPDGIEVTAGVLVVGFGVLLGASTLRAHRGSRPHQVWGAACLLLLALGMGLMASRDADGARCVTDTYSGIERCVGRTWAVTRQLLATAVPTALAAAGLLSIRSGDRAIGTAANR